MWCLWARLLRCYTHTSRSVLQGFRCGVYASKLFRCKGRVLETADAFLDDKADRLWKTRTAALRELAQKVRDGTNLVLLCAGRIESCHGDLLRKAILAEAAQLEATSKRKPRSDKGKPRGPRGPYGRDSPGLHEESGVLQCSLRMGGAVCTHERKNKRQHELPTASDRQVLDAEC